jgi:putative ABC transport system permease protein
MIASESSFEAFFLEPRAVVIDQGLAVSEGLAPGGSLPVQVNGRLETLEVLGVIRVPEGEDRQGISDVLFMDVASAQELLDLEGSLTRIDLIASDVQAKDLIAFLPPGVRLEPAAAQRETLTQLTGAFQLNLQALSLLALVVGMFLIYNTTMFSVLQRREVFGILRSLGATGRQIAGMIVMESLFVAVLGAALGIGLGWLLGKGAVGLTSQTINDLYFAVQVQQVELPLGSVFKGLLAGLGASTLAAGIPAWEAANVPPVVILQRSQLESGAQRWSLRAIWAGLIMLLAGTSLLYILPNSLIASFAGLFFILLGLALLVPGCTVLLMKLIQPLLQRIFGPIGKIASGTVIRSLSRTSIAIAALMVSLSVAIGVGIMINSFRSTVTEWLDLTLRADLFISAPTIGGARPFASLPASTKARLTDLPGVDMVEAVRAVTVQSTQGEVVLLAVDASRVRDESLYRFASGNAAQVWDQVQGGAVIVSEPFAYRYDLPSLGGQVTLLTDNGLETFPVVGIFYDYTSDRGTVLMAEKTYREYWRDETISSLAVFLEPGADLAASARSVRAALSGTGLQVQENRSLRDQALEIFDRTFLITSALRLLAVIVAFIGVLSATLALMLDRRREFATMQALGLDRLGMWRLTLLETGLMGMAAGLFSLPTGMVLALILTYVINLRSFGWTIRFEVEPAIFLGALAIALAAALLAGIYPGFQLQRMSIAKSLTQE